MIRRKATFAVYVVIDLSPASSTVVGRGAAVDMSTPDHPNLHYLLQSALGSRSPFDALPTYLSIQRRNYRCRESFTLNSSDRYGELRVRQAA